MDDDFNTGGATGDLFEIARSMNRFIDGEQLEEAAKRTPENIAWLVSGMSILKELGAILGIFIKPPKQSNNNDGTMEVLDGLMQLLIQVRAEARVRTGPLVIVDVLDIDSIRIQPPQQLVERSNGHDECHTLGSRSSENRLGKHNARSIGGDLPARGPSIQGLDRA